LYYFFKGLLAVTDDVLERKIILERPFGNLTVVFSGDLWQLDPVASTKNKVFIKPFQSDDIYTVNGKQLCALISKGQQYY
jgi:hypothetical protein